MRKLFILLFFSASSLLMAQNTNPIQEAMANYDYETALKLMEQETPTVPLLYQKGRALKGLGYNDKALLVFQEIIEQDSPRALILKPPSAASPSPNKGRRWITTRVRSILIRTINMCEYSTSACC